MLIDVLIFFVDGCRSVKFLLPQLGQYLEGHVFENLTVEIHSPCENQCAIKSRCVSVNIGPIIEDEVTCELCDSDHFQHPQDLKNRPGWTYRGTEV